jgi:hypothetical protein
MNEQGGARPRGIGRPFTKNDPRRAKGGRPKGVSLVTLLQRELSQPCAPSSKVTKREMFIARCVDLALAGRPEMIRLIWEYIEGKPDQRFILDVYDVAREMAEARGVSPEKVISILDALKKRQVS